MMNKLTKFYGSRYSIATRSFHAWCRISTMALLMVVPISVNAKLPYPESLPTENEWRLLPEYCPDTQGFKYGLGKSPNAAKWVEMMGETFWALHHYCLGILKFGRS